MTVTYTAEVATCTGLGCFWKLLFRWRGSIYKLLWPNLLVYTAVYFTLSVVYRVLLNEEHRLLFEKIALHCQAYGELIPISFVLGFYVSIVIKRWWDQYICMPWPDNMAMFVSTLVHGQDDRGRLMRRTIIRYVNLCFVITLRMMSPRVKKRFPTMDHLVEAGFMQPNEKKIFEKTSHPKYWMPLVWAGGIITRARKEGRVKDDFSLKSLIDGLNNFRAGCGGMLNYDWISIPLVYTQVVTLAVYTYFMATLMGNQFLNPEKKYPKHEIDLIVPVFTFLQFFFYMGWLKVAESLVNPFGEDDDDFELNWLVDRNLQVSYVIVDEMHQEHPEMVKDQYWDEVFPAELPYTAAAKQYQTGPPLSSTENVEVSLEQAEFMPLDTVIEESPGDLDDLADIDLDDDDCQLNDSRRETHPMKILKSKKQGSTNTINASSFSVTRPERKSSVLNMLTKIFRRNESSKDLGAESNMGSSVSLPGRRGRHSISRMSSISQSQAQSRTSMARENTFPEEMFHMSDVSLTGSILTMGSHIQMVAPPHDRNRRQSGDHELDDVLDTSEVTQLLPINKARDSPRKISFSKDTNITAEEKAEQMLEKDDISEASGSSVKTSYYQESLAKGKKKLEKRAKRDTGPYSPNASFMEQTAEIDFGTSAARIVMPSSPPVKHVFVPISSSVPIPVKEGRRIKSLTQDDKPLSRTSSLTRSVQQHKSMVEKEKQQPPPSETSQMLSASPKPMADKFSYSKKPPDVSLIERNVSTDPSSPPVVSWSASIVPTTSIVTTSTMTYPTMTTSISSPVSSTIVQMPIDQSEEREQSQEPCQYSSVIITVDKPENDQTEVPPVYVPSAAIPVPTMSPAHERTDTAVPQRRTLHDFRELEPISEQGEMIADSPYMNTNIKDDLSESTV
uniref:Bestrophin homolog n=1 Tax=Timema tahoe TaxID=61484 RepID=A0A7R9FGP5_9NEOP|nr:unnamed protein product [Timema tahoe]